ncbi:MAG: DUF4397 domain-containing protein [Acetivibrio sp.]
MNNEQVPSTTQESPFSEDYPLQTLPSDFPVPDFDQPNRPVFPSVPNFPSIPIYPNKPNYPGGGIGSVIIPIFPGSVSYAQVRFLHAAAGYPPVTISIGPKMITSKIAYENLTSYNKISSGYRTVTIAEASNPRNVVYRKSISFLAGSQVTFAITNSVSGLQLVEVSDQLCSNKSWSSGCLRVVNLSYGSGSFDITLENGETIFSDIAFTEISPFKQANRGSYRISVYQSTPGIQPRSGYGPLITFPLEVMGNEMYTVYLVGSTYARPELSPVIVTNA